MRRNKWVWFWVGGAVCFRNDQGGEYVRYGYQHSDAVTLTDYLNTRG